MSVRKVPYAKHIPGQIDHHYIAFLTRFGKILLMGFFLKSGDAKRVAENIMGGKASSSTFIPFPGVFVLEREHYDKNLVEMARTGELIDCIVIENAPESTEETLAFADKTFKAQGRGS